MDPHSEVEAKFSADWVYTWDFKNFMGKEQLPCGARVSGFKHVFGTDRYYLLNGRPLRFRFGGDKMELTYKERKSEESIQDRVEINLVLQPGTPPPSVDALLKALGAKECFEIWKSSAIYHVHGKYEGVDYAATVVLYDVYPKDSFAFQRYLEVEVEATSDCSPEQGMKVLDAWVEAVKNRFTVKGPMNKSLYEIYSSQGT